jgi:pimeloyl-ACP methyl ester carboxylesterase
MPAVSATHREELVYTESLDGYLLEGAVFTPASSGSGTPPVVWMHGFTGRFYEPHTVAIGRRLVARGHVFVTGNNRGHHLGANVANLRGGEPLRGGGWWERFEDAPNDLSAWVGFAVGLGFPRVVLVGHSLGALKVVHYMGNRGDDRVAALVSASGPVRVGERLREASERLALAERMAAEGRGQELLPSDGSPFVTSAQALVSRVRAGMDVYGLQDPDPPVARVRCPLLYILGSEEPTIGVEADLPMLRRNARSASRVDAVYVEGADHVYTGHEQEVADRLGDWIERLG